MGSERLSERWRENLELLEMATGDTSQILNDVVISMSESNLKPSVPRHIPQSQGIAKKYNVGAALTGDVFVHSGS